MSVGLRVFWFGGLTSYRALFNWMSPYLFVPVMVVAPLFQVVFFAYLGRAAHVESDTFYVIGNAVQLTALPCLFATGQTIVGERNQQTLQPLLASPANRVALFLGRTVPVIANGWVVAALAFALGHVLLDVHVPANRLPALALVVAACSFSCTGLGLVNASLGFRIRDISVVSNVVFALLLIFCGVNVPLDALPGWMATASQGLPLTHGIAAARAVAGGASLGSVASDVLVEVGIGCVYLAAGFALLRFWELQGRRHATLERV